MKQVINHTIPTRREMNAIALSTAQEETYMTYFFEELRKELVSEAMKRRFKATIHIGNRMHTDVRSDENESLYFAATKELLEPLGYDVFRHKNTAFMDIKWGYDNLGGALSLTGGR